ncbi:MAG: radical SAM protein [Azospirillaceae bacterium]|nr:radical SAM protein [Azospirillaceae bacterium]
MWMSDGDLLALQRQGEHHIGLSLTAACPMTCSHCAAATVPARDHAKVGMAADLVARFCGELPALAARGVTRLSLTGGEPILALGAVADLSRAARAAGVATTVVTGLFWATSAASRRRIIAALPDVDCWNISWDRFHAAYVKLAHVVAAVGDLRAAGVRVTLRVATAGEDDPHLAALARALPDTEIAVQPILPVGRAAVDTPPATGAEEAPRWPCLSTGPLVMPDGTARPCCSAMMEEPDHPFAARTARDGLVALHRAWLDDPLLLLIRALGFRPVLRLLRILAPDHPLLAGTAPHPCAVCATLFRDPALAGRLADAARAPALAAQVRAAATVIFPAPPTPSPSPVSSKESRHAHAS